MLARKSGTVAKVILANKAGAYQTAKQVGLAMEVKGAVEDSGATSDLLSLTVLDPANQKSALDVYFFSQAPAVGADDAAISISVADLANLLGVVNIPTTAYSTANVVAVGTVANIKLKLRASKTAPAQSNTSIWVLVATRGTPTYGANALALQLGLSRD